MFLSKILKNQIIPNNVRKYSQNISKEFNVEYLSGENTGIAVLSFNRPKQKNSLGANLVKEINEALYKITVESQPRVALLRSTVPGVFCAGADLKERASMPIEQVTNFVTNLQTLTCNFYNLPFPVIACLDGVALGGGLEIALSCDFRIAANNAKMGLVETKLAIIPGAGGTQYLPRLINPSIAKELIYTARVLTGEEAKNLGIVNHVVEQNSTNDAAFQKSLEIARQIIPNGPVAVKMAKIAINKGLDVDLNTGLSMERACYAQLILTKDRVEGLEAFKEKRKPNYSGK